MSSCFDFTYPAWIHALVFIVRCLQAQLAHEFKYILHLATGARTHRSGIRAWAKQEQKVSGQNPKTEFWFLGSLLAFPDELMLLSCAQ